MPRQKTQWVRNSYHRPDRLPETEVREPCNELGGGWQTARRSNAKRDTSTNSGISDVRDCCVTANGDRVTFTELLVTAVLFLLQEPSITSWYSLLLFIHYLRLGRHPVAGVVTRYISTDCEEFTLTFWRRIIFQILAHSVFKMWVIQKPNKVALWNKRHFDEEKMEIIQHV